MPAFKVYFMNVFFHINQHYEILAYTSVSMHLVNVNLPCETDQQSCTQINLCWQAWGQTKVNMTSKHLGSQEVAF